MKRLGLVLFVCLCLQISGVSAPFVHLHADADHETTHHDGCAVHRHIAAHQATEHGDDHRPGGSSATGVAVADDAASIGLAGESIVGGVGSPAARLPHPPVAQTPPETEVPQTPPPERVVEAAKDVGQRVPRSPDLSSSPLRGPPR